MNWTTMRKVVTAASMLAALTPIFLVAGKYWLDGPSAPEGRSFPIPNLGYRSLY